MASWEIRMDTSLGKSTSRRFAICSGLQDLAHRRSGTSAMATTDPGDVWATNELAVRLGDLAGQAVLHVFTELVVLRKPRDLGPPGAPVRVPLRSDRAVARRTRSGGGIAPQFAADSRRGAPHLAGELPDAAAARLQDGNLFALGSRSGNGRPTVRG